MKHRHNQQKYQSTENSFFCFPPKKAESKCSEFDGVGGASPHDPDTKINSLQVYFQCQVPEARMFSST